MGRLAHSGIAEIAVIGKNFTADERGSTRIRTKPNPKGGTAMGLQFAIAWDLSAKSLRSWDERGATPIW